nr:peritrophin-48 precursor [Chrysomya bezziana]
MKAKTLTATLALILLAFAQADYDVASYCQLVQSGTKLPSLDSCQNYYTCVSNGLPTLSSCSSGYVFNKDSQQCVPTGSFNCFFGVANPCQNQDKKFVPSAKQCNEWHYCLAGAIAGTGTCKEGQIFNFAKQSCVYGECSNTGNNILDSPNLSVCQIMPHGIYFGDNTNCSTWHKCSGMEEKKGTCPNGDNFDPTYASCVPSNMPACSRIQNPPSTGVVSGPPSTSPCSLGTVVGDITSCSVYYKCENATRSNSTIWNTYTCSSQFFDVISKQCTSTNPARTFKGCIRCQFTTGSMYWVNAVDPQCSEYFTCSNGLETKSTASTCGAGNFFNEDLQYCMIGNSTVGQYAQTHGACENYTCNPNTRLCNLVTATNTTSSHR